MRKTIVFSLIFTIILALFSCDGRAQDTVPFDKKTTKIIAHRGLSGLEIENTEKAFVAAGERSYYGIEADVRKTADGKFVICHDKTLGRISKENLNVEKSTLEELLNVDLSMKNMDGTARICELSTYISVCKSYGKHAFLELKSEFTKEEIGRIIDIINSYEYIDGVTFISFEYTNLEHVRTFLPYQSVQYLFSKIDDATIKRMIDDRIDAAMSYKILTEEILKKFHDAGLTVNCWTVDDKTKAEKLASLGVDYITTNILE